MPGTHGRDFFSLSLTSLDDASRKRRASMMNHYTVKNNIHPWFILPREEEIVVSCCCVVCVCVFVCVLSHCIIICVAHEMYAFFAHVRCFVAKAHSYICSHIFLECYIYSLFITTLEYYEYCRCHSVASVQLSIGNQLSSSMHTLPPSG